MKKRGARNPREVAWRSGRWSSGWSSMALACAVVPSRKNFHIHSFSPYWTAAQAKAVLLRGWFIR